MDMETPQGFAKRIKINPVMVREILRFCGFRPELEAGTSSFYKLADLEKVLAVLEGLRAENKGGEKHEH